MNREIIFKIWLIIVDAIILATTDKDDKISKILGVLAIILLSLSFLGR